MIKVTKEVGALGEMIHVKWSDAGIKINDWKVYSGEHAFYTLQDARDFFSFHGNKHVMDLIKL